MSEDFKVPARELERRKNTIQKALQDSGIDGLLVIQRVDLFYFSGTSQNGFLYIPAEGEPLLMIKKYMPRARRESSLRHIHEIASVKEIPAAVTDMYGRLPEHLGLELDVIPVRDFNYYRTLFPGLEFIDAAPLILKVRSIKSPWEIRQMENTAELSRKTFEYMTSVIRPGITEMEFAGMYEAFARKHGHGGKLRVRDYQTEGYAWHVLSGRSGGMLGLLDSPASGEGTSAAFPCGAGNKPLSSNEPIMVDLSTVLNGYHMDETRMFAIGSMPERAFETSRGAIEIHDAVLDRVKPGVALDELFQHAQSRAVKLGYAEVFLGPPGYKVSFVAHGIGLELVESPIIARGRRELIEPGMMFALEPKMVYESEFCAGIESVFVVTETGSRLISRVPVDIFVC
ncbi:MAG: M24 family metallopeptidase [Desulfatiglandales bacterium]